MYQTWINCKTKQDGDNIAILASRIESVEEMHNAEDNASVGCVITLIGGVEYYVADTFSQIWDALTVVSQ